MIINILKNNLIDINILKNIKNLFYRNANNLLTFYNIALLLIIINYFTILCIKRLNGANGYKDNE